MASPSYKVRIAFTHRSVTDGVTTSGSTTVTSANANFTTDDVGTGLSGAGIPPETYIAQYVNDDTVELSQEATASDTGVTFTFASTPYDTNETWTDVSSYVRGISTRSGRSKDTERVDTGTATILLSNSDRRFDPTNTVSPYWPNVRPRVKVEAYVIDNAIEYRLFTGFVESWSLEYLDRVDPVVTVQCTDIFKIFEGQDIQTYSDQVLASLPIAYFKLDEVSGSVAADSAPSPATAVDATYTGFSASDLANRLGPFDAGKSFPNFVAANADYIDLGANAKYQLGGSDFTLEAWVRPDLTTSGNVLALGYDTTGSPSGTPAFIALLKHSSSNFMFSQSDDLSIGETSVTGSALVGSWCHVACVRRSGVIEIWTSGVLESATSSPHSRNTLDAQRIGSTDIIADFDGSIAHVAIYDYALSGETIGAHSRTTLDEFAPTDEGTAIEAILDSLGVVEQSTGSGVDSLQAFAPVGNVLEQLQQLATENSEGLLWVGPDGTTHYTSRAELWARGIDGPDLTFGDVSPEISYNDITLEFDDQDVYTQVIVEREGGAAQTAESVSARQKYGVRTFVRSNLLLSTDAQTIDRAAGLLDRYKEPNLRISDLETPMLKHSVADRRLVLLLTLGDLVSVKRRPPGVNNMLSTEQSSFEAKDSGWLATSSATVPSRTSDAARTGSYSLQMTATSTGTMTVKTDPNDAVPVDGSTSYSGSAYFKAAATSRSVRVDINWYDSSATLISTSTGSTVSDSTGSWTQATITASSPSNAVFASLAAVVLSPIADEIHYVDDAKFAEGSDTTWSGLGGIAKDMSIQGIEHDIVPGRVWTTKFYLASFDDGGHPWQLGSSRYSALGSTTILGW